MTKSQLIAALAASQAECAALSIEVAALLSAQRPSRYAATQHHAERPDSFAARCAVAREMARASGVAQLVGRTRA